MNPRRRSAAGPEALVADGWRTSLPHALEPGELFDNPGAERRQVVGPAAGGDVLVGDHLLVDDSPAGVADVGPDARVGGQGAAVDDPGLDERPRTMADHADRLAALDKVADEADGRLILAQMIGVDRSARQDEGIVVSGGRLADQPVHGERDRRVDVLIHGLDLARLDRQQLGDGAGRLDRLPGSLEFHLLHAVRGADRDGLAPQLACHIAPPLQPGQPRWPARPAPGGPRARSGPLGPASPVARVCDIPSTITHGARCCRHGEPPTRLPASKKSGIAAGTTTGHHYTVTWDSVLSMPGSHPIVRVVCSPVFRPGGAGSGAVAGAGRSGPGPAASRR